MKKLITPLLIIVLVNFVSAQESLQVPDQFTNPIISGFHPDPSICRVGDDYYLVNSSFEWYPGLPIFHSKDLVNWELIGYGIHRPDQVPIPEGLQDSRGVYAPTIRYHDGLFYIINTCVQCDGNFYITAEHPEGPWSDPVWLHSRGIDPDLFWDDDGRCYYTGHANISGLNDWPDKNGAWMQELDLEQQKLIGPKKQLTHGHAKNARWTEGPHIYKIDGKYMLLVAEGGTGYHHSITVHHSDSVWGPYVPNHSNPVLSHRQFGMDYPVHAVGHGDLVQTPEGDWWFVGLGKRKVDGHTLLARETFLTPVVFEDQGGVLTPVFNPGVGGLSVQQNRPDLPWSPSEKAPQRDEFSKESLALEWNFLRTPFTSWYRLKKDELFIDLRPEVLNQLKNPSFIARRIKDHQWEASTKMGFQSEKMNEKAGLVIYRNSKNHFQLLREKDHLVLIETSTGKTTERGRVECNVGTVILKAVAKNAEVQFSCKIGDVWKTIGETQDLSIISDEQAGGFNGPFVGMYASSFGSESKKKAVFDWFEYIGMD